MNQPQRVLKKNKMFSIFGSKSDQDGRVFYAVMWTPKHRFIGKFHFTGEYTFAK